MSGVTLQRVIKRYGDAQVIHGVDLTVEDEEGFLDPTHRMRQEAAAWARQQRAEEGEGEESE